MKKVFIIFVSYFIAIAANAQQARLKITGIVLDEQNKPLDFVTVTLINTDKSTFTDALGLFNFTLLNTADTKNINIKVAMVGKLSIDTVIPIAQALKRIIFQLKNLNLNLKEVQVSALRNNKGQSNSSVLFNRQAIEQAQAFILTDFLNNLPGKLSSPLDLQAPKNLTLRSTVTGNAALNNSLGTAIIIDGLAQSNNANMQNKNLGSFGLGGSLISDSKNRVDYDVTFGGLDLREIPADNIESIEVISGVAPAQYSDLTDGAVIIKRQAGKTDFQFNTRINSGSTNFSLTKGYQLNKKVGFLNFNFNYLMSNNDPRDNMKKYSRLTGGLMHTKYFFGNIKNTFSIDFSEKFDDAKQDPDDGRDLMTYSKNRKITLANRTSVEIDKGFLKRISLNIGADFGAHESYAQWYLNGNPKPMANKDTTGVYEGFYIPGTYTAKDHIVGKPKNFNGNLSFSSQFNTSGITHFLSYGTNLSISSNKGQGVLFDPEYPRFSNQGFKNERPYNFQLIPNLVNAGFYAEDRFNLKLLRRDLNFTAGVRYDLQNGFGNLQPRLNTNYNITNNVKFNMAFGIATKAPTLAYRYPGATYFDIPLINYYTGDSRNSLLLVYTHKYTPDNSKLKPSQSNQFETGFSYDGKFLNASVYGYIKKNKNGFNTQTNYLALSVPEYNYTIVAPNAKPSYYPTGNYVEKTGLSFSEVTNNTSSKNRGIELFVSTKKIKPIQTSLSFNSSLARSIFHNVGTTIKAARDEDINAGKKAWYGVYKSTGEDMTSLMSKLNTDTHIPKLGLVVSLYFDLVWLKNDITLENMQYPIAYLDKYANYYPIDSFDPNNTDYGHLSMSADLNKQAKLPFMYGNLSMRISKELKKKIRFSVNAYNIFNLKAQYFDDITKQSYNYINPINIGAELSIKF
ncbi:TonB-dependent receptor [Pedobacter sp.]